MVEEALSWDRDGADWPLRRFSRFVSVGHLRWHLQVLAGPPAEDAAIPAGTAPSGVYWLLHGTGASGHTWRDLAPLLAQHRAVISVDLPGHGYTRGAVDRDLTLDGMAQALLALHHHLNPSAGTGPIALPSGPSIWIGHSAGAAVALRVMDLDPPRAPLVVGLNGAVLPWGRFASDFFMPLARTLATNDWAVRFFAWSARRPGTVEQLLRDTGSTIDPWGIELYRRLAHNGPHVRAVLRMMAQWDLAGLQHDLPQLKGRVVLITGAADRTVPPAVSREAAERIPGAAWVGLPRWGHLGHEEAPAEWASLILQMSRV